VVVDKKSGKVIATCCSNGRKHDFRVFKESKTVIHPKIKVIVDTGYQGIQKIHSNSKLPKKRRKNQTLTKDEKRDNRKISSSRVLNENVIAALKRFKVIAERYRNRRKRFALRFNLIAGMYNWNLV
jgi:hypothetical protein